MSRPSETWDDIRGLAEYHKYAPSKKGKRKPSANPLIEGINTYLPNFHKQIAGANDFLPSRYLLYPPLLLLPATFTTLNVIWEAEFNALSPTQRNELYATIVAKFNEAGQRVTHIALHARIRTGVQADVEEEVLNVTRKPTGFTPLYGSWGPDTVEQGGPTSHDFERAFWVSTKQDHGITQTWAPRWTMFSQGNLSEKKRVLGKGGRDIFEGQTDDEIKRMQVLDMFVGIGYFALCYIARGVHRVWGWDLNGWSIEGLRRGCEANRWKCTIIQVSDDGETNPTLQELAQQLQEENSLPRDQHTRCIAFRGDNKHAVGVMGRLEESRLQLEVFTTVLLFDHVNLGLLPDSNLSWPAAMTLVASKGRLHVHRNVHTQGTGLETSLEEALNGLSQDLNLGKRSKVVHTERVKMYGPQIEHCVFDVQIDRQQITAV